MKTEKIMQEIMKAIELSGTSESVIRFMNNDPDIFNCKTLHCSTENILAKLYLDLREDLRKENNKKSSPSQSKVIDNVMKIVKKEKERLYGYSEYYDNKFAFLDEYRMFISDNDFGYKENENQIDKQRLKNLIPTSTEKIVTIDTTDLKTMIKENGITRSKNPSKKYYLVNNEIAFNPIYLLDAIEFADNNIIEYNNPMMPAIIRDNKQEIISLVLPVKIK